MRNERAVKIWQASARLHWCRMRLSIRGKMRNTSTALTGLAQVRCGTLPRCEWDPSLTWLVALLRRVRRSNLPHVISSLPTYVRKLSLVVTTAGTRNNTVMFIGFILGTGL
jgi:hypothetical protein